MKNPLIKSEKWLETYYSRVSGSTSATAVGLSPYMSRSALATAMLDPTSRNVASTPDMERGTLGESAALFRLQQAIGIEVEPHDQDQFVFNPRYPFAHCLPDGYAGNDACEVKVSRYAVVKKIMAYGLPRHWILQAQHNMAVTNVDQLHFGVLNFDNQLFHYETILRNQALIDLLMPAEEMFLEAVQRGEIPEDGPAIADETNELAVDRVITDPHALALTRLFIDRKNQADILDEQIDAAKQELQEILGESCQTFEFKGVARGTWKPSKPRKSFDHEAAVKHDPSLVRFYTEGNAARPFIVRAIK